MARIDAAADGVILRYALDDLMGAEPHPGTVEQLTFDANTNILLASELQRSTDAWRLSGGILYNNGVIQQVNPPGQALLDTQAAQAAKIVFRNLPNWATWTDVEAISYVTNAVLNGWTKAQLDTYVDTNVTNIATAKTALKQLGEELIDLRDICTKLAQAVILLRDIAVRKVS